SKTDRKEDDPKRRLGTRGTLARIELERDVMEKIAGEYFMCPSAIGREAELASNGQFMSDEKNSERRGKKNVDRGRRKSLPPGLIGQWCGSQYCQRIAIA